MSQHRIAHVYNPENQPMHVLAENFVIRKKQFKKIYEDIKNTKLSDSPQHYVIEGQRGTGKTTLLLRIKYELERNAHDNHLIAVKLPEEQYGVYSIVQLFEAIVDRLEGERHRVLIEEIENQNNRLSKEDAFLLIDNHLKKINKRLVILIDNVGILFDKFSQLDLAFLRDIFHQSKNIQLISSSSVALESSFDYSKPFFEFFKRIRLDSLNNEESRELLNQLARSSGKSNQVEEILEKQPGRIEVLRRMTGGVPRTIVLIFEILINNSKNVFEDLEVILDKVTPLYKHRMDDLPDQQQMIVNSIALNWDGISAKGIVDSINLPEMVSKKISAQLRLLERSQFIESKMINKKDKIYFVKERFFNIWYLMRFGKKKNRENVKWLVRFLQEWCTKDELRERAQEYIERIRSRTINSTSAYYQAQAFASIISDDLILQHEVILETNNFLTECDSPLVSELTSSEFDSLKFRANNGDGDSAYRFAKLLDDNLENYEEAEKFYKTAIKLEVHEALISLGELYHYKLNKPKKARKYYLKAIDKDITKAHLNLGHILIEEFDDLIAAEKSILTAQSLDVSGANNSLGVLYSVKIEDYEKAKTYYLKSIAKGEIVAIRNLGVLYHKKMNDIPKSLEYLNKAVKEGVVEASLNIGDIYVETGDYDKAEHHYNEALENGANDALLNLGYFYYEKLNDKVKANKVFEDALRVGKIESRIILGMMYKYELKDYELAEKHFRYAIESNQFEGYVHLGNLYVEKLNNLESGLEYLKKAIQHEVSVANLDIGWVYEHHVKDYKKAKEYYLKAMKNHEEEAAVQLACLHFRKLDDYTNARTYFKQAIELGNINSLNSLAWLNFEKARKPKEALNYSLKSVRKEKRVENLHTLMVVQLWNDMITESMNTFEEWYKNYFSEKELDELMEYSVMLLAKEQYNHLNHLFSKHENLKDIIKPIYFALMKVTEAVNRVEYLKMGSELAQTVEEILEEVERIKKKYN